MKNDQVLNLGAKVPRCPLCHEFMERKRRTLAKRFLFLFVCEKPACKIACDVNDPFVGRWEEAYHNATDGQGIACPMPECEKPMRYFATATGYMKAVCPACGAAMSNGGTRKEGTVESVTPDAPGIVQ